MQFAVVIGNDIKSFVHILQFETAERFKKLILFLEGIFFGTRVEKAGSYEKEKETFEVILDLSSLEMLFPELVQLKCTINPFDCNISDISCEPGINRELFPHIQGNLH